MDSCGYVFYFEQFLMNKFRKILIVVYVLIIIGHIVLYITKEEDFTSCVLGVVTMILFIISILISKCKEV